MVFLGRNFESGFIRTLKSKKPQKPKKTIKPKNLLKNPKKNYVFFSLA